MCLTLPFIPTFGGGDVKAYLIIFEPNLAHNLVLLGIIKFTISLMCRGINPLSISLVLRGGNPPHDQKYTYVISYYLFVVKQSYPLVK